MTPVEIERVKVERLTQVKPSTVNREVGFLKHVFNVAIRDDKTDHNPVSKVRMLKEPSGRVRYLSDAEEMRLMSVLTTESECERIRFLVQTGLRKSEFANLRWKDLDMKAGVITIPRSKNGETRHVPMTSVVRSILGRMPRPIDPSVLVFPSTEGTPHTHWAEKAFPEAIRAAHIGDFRFHDLRHTFASRLAMEGVDLLTIKELGGWKTLSMVQRYAHLSPSHRNHAIERLVTRKVETQVPVSESGVAL